jgi:hypothetical protein
MDTDERRYAIDEKPSRVFSAIRFAALSQLPFLFLTALILDSGKIFQTAIIAALAFWVGTLVLILARRRIQTRDDFQFIRYGYWIVFGIAVAIVRLLGIR